VTAPIAAAADILLAPPPLATAERRAAAAAGNRYPARRRRLRKTGAYYYFWGSAFLHNSQSHYALQKMGRHKFPLKNCPFAWGVLDPGVVTSLGPTESISQTESRSIQPLCAVHGRDS